MVEKLKNNGIEQTEVEVLKEAGRERSAEIENSYEQQDTETSPEINAENARYEALEIANSNEKPAQTSEKEERASEVLRPAKPTKAELNKNFDRTMNTVRKDMKPASRTFSKVIHNRAVEAASDMVGGTIARPNLIIAGGLGTIILCSAAYLVAKRYGYTLSGFEAIGTFILGWSIGAIIEFARVGFTNRKNRS
ncbi:hypothetical protein B7Z17_02615 [Candidatus Saccharibacteria bacterium 32-49-10]|nr:MAG: hypothetical protein B7Z17_02615 [Candidatus Saccharibacteria bacterium 32-49-10]